MYRKIYASVASDELQNRVRVDAFHVRVYEKGRGDELERLSRGRDIHDCRADAFMHGRVRKNPNVRVLSVRS